MKHKILRKLSAAVLVLAMVCLQLPVGAFATDESTDVISISYSMNGEISTSSYADVSSASTGLTGINSDATDITITLNQDIETETTWDIERSCTLDLNGHVFKNTYYDDTWASYGVYDGRRAFDVGQSANDISFCIKDSIGSGRITNAYNTLILAGTLDNNALGNKATVTIEGGTFGNSDKQNYLIVCRGTLNVSGGTINGAVVSTFGTFNMSSGTIKGVSGNSWQTVYTQSSNVNITGGTIESEDVAALALTDADSTKAPSVSIIGGTLTTNKAGSYATPSSVISVIDPKLTSITIGGTAKVTSTAVPAVLINDNSVKTELKVEDQAVVSGTYIVYDNIQDDNNVKVTGGGSFGYTTLPYYPNSSFISYENGKSLSSTKNDSGYYYLTEKEEVDFTALNAAITAATDLYNTSNSSNLYSSDSWTTFSDAYTAATAIQKSKVANQAEVTYRAKALDTARTSLELTDSSAFKFGGSNTVLNPGTYTVPVSLMNADNHSNYSAAASCINGSGTLVVDNDGTAKLTVPLTSVTFLSITDWAYDWKIYQENSYESKKVDATQTKETIDGTERVTSITFDIPSAMKSLNGVYCNMYVDAMGRAPDAWLSIDYKHAQDVNVTSTTSTGTAEVTLFGGYAVHVAVTQEDGKITALDYSADSWEGTKQEENQTYFNKAKNAYILTSSFVGMDTTDADAIMAVDTVTGATYSSDAIKEAICSALGIEPTPEVINVPTKKLEAGTYTVDISYYTDVVAHGLTGVTAKETSEATLTVDADGNITLNTPIVNGTDKEPLYVLGYNGYYTDNDTTKDLTMTGVELETEKSDYSDTYFEKGTKVVTDLTMPLVGDYAAEYATNVELYVPAMNALNGTEGGIEFKNGVFDVNAYIKVYWDSLVQTSKATTSLADGTYQITGKMVTANKQSDSMANKALENPITLIVKDGAYTIQPSFTGIEVSGMYGYLGSLSYYSGSDMTGSTTKAEVLSYQTDEDGNNIVDAYNSASSPYPKQVSLPLTEGYGMEYVPLSVNVPLMASLGAGDQNVWLQLDWSTVEAVDDTDEPDEPTEPDEPDTPDTPDEPTTTDPIYTDVQNESAYYYDPVYWAVEKGITNGTSATTFSPKMDCTRAQVATFLWRAAGSPEPTVSSTRFTDLDENAYYYDAVLWAYEQGIIKGMTKTTFEPDTTVTRAQFVVMLYRYMDEPKASVKTSPFMDMPEENESNYWYYNAVLWAYGEGITTGTTPTTFEPSTNCNRAQVVTFMYRALK